uniref:Cilia- and flagella-associated protein 263 n=1 Tax=Amphiprion percula TaxID=161767 RepID=A0A3P8RW38_AMPPE
HPRYSNAVLRAENAMFEQFLGRLDPQELLAPAEGEGPGVKGSSQLEGGVSARRCIYRLQLLTLEQKLYMVQREVRETREDQEKLKQKYERTQDEYKASMEEAELCLAEIKKAKYEFERKLLKPMKDNRLAMKEPEKVIQYIKDKLKICVCISSYRSEYFCFCKQEKLQSATLESAELSNDISKRRQLLAKIEEEIQHAEEERLKAEAFNQHLRRQLTHYQAPDITEYMYVKDKLKKLRQNVHTWERKVGIAEMALKTHTKAWSKPRSTLTPANSVVAGSQPGDHRLPVKLPNIAENNT